MSSLNDCQSTEYTMLQPTNGEDADRLSGGRCVDDRSRPAGGMQEHDQCRLDGGCGIPIWKPSVLRQGESRYGISGV